MAGIIKLKPAQPVCGLGVISKFRGAQVDVICVAGRIQAPFYHGISNKMTDRFIMGLFDSPL